MSEVLSFSSARAGLEAAVHTFRSLYAAGAKAEPLAAEVHGSVRARLLPELAIFERTLSGLSLTRSPREIRQTGFDHCTIQHVVSGELRLDFGNDRRVLRAGESTLVDTTKPFTLQASTCRFYTLSVPRRHVSEAGVDMARLHGGAPPIDRAEAHAACAALLSGVDANDAGALLHRLLRTPTARRRPAARRLDGRERAMTVIESHLHRSDLTPEFVTAASHVSRATLYRAFTELGGVSEWILARRLRRLRSALDDPRPLAELIEDFGFVSLSHATQAFRSRYGVPPGMLRAMRRADPAVTDSSEALTRRLLADIPAALASSRLARAQAEA